MPKYNLTHGWTASSIAPTIPPAPTPTAPSTQSYGQTATSSNVPSPMLQPAVQPPTQPGARVLPTKSPTLSQMTAPDPYAVLKAAALGKSGLGKTYSASAYQVPDAPAYLADAVNNLNGSAGYAQQDLTNLLLSQILGAQQHPMTEDLHAAETAAKDAENKKNIAEAKEKAAKDAHDQELKLTRLRSNATMTPYSGWMSPAVPISQSFNF